MKTEYKNKIQCYS